VTAKICQYGSCMEDVGEQGVTVSLRTPTPDGETRAIYCSVVHAVAALRRLVEDRKESGIYAPMPDHWRTT